MKMQPCTGVGQYQDSESEAQEERWANTAFALMQELCFLTRHKVTWQAAPSPPAARRDSTLEQSLGQSKGIYLPSSLSHLPLAKIITCRSHHLAPFWPLRARCPHSQDAVFCASLKEEDGPSPLGHRENREEVVVGIGLRQRMEARDGRRGTFTLPVCCSCWHLLMSDTPFFWTVNYISPIPPPPVTDQ